LQPLSFIYRITLATILLLCSYAFSFGQAANFTVSIPSKQGCSPLSINFTDVSTGGIVNTRTWNLGNGVVIPNGLATVGANYITPGKYYITLTAVFSNGVSSVKVDSIIVHPKPVANFLSTDSIGCAAHTANFLSTSTTSTGSLTNYQWDFGPGGTTGTNALPNFTYNTAGLYQVSLIVRNNWGCVSNAETKAQYVKVFSRPNASFNVNPYYSCENTFTAIFTNTTTGGDPTRNKYEWDFGDGSPIETTQNAMHLYTGTGNYIAKLTVRLGNNCVSTYTRTIYVGKPTATITSFPTQPVCVNTPINFVGVGSANSSYERWFFTDNNQTQYYGNVNHTFTSTGTFEVMLISINAVGCADTVRRNVTVKPGPIIDFTPDLPSAACIPHTVTFVNNTVGTDLKFAWNYGDGSPTDTINGNGNATHVYTNFGTYPVTVYARDTSTADGCFAYKTFNYIRIYRPTVTLAVIPPNGCMPLPVILNATVSNPAGVPITSYTWDYGDGSPVGTTTVPTNTHIYTTAGAFPATVTINMQGGCSYTSAIRVVTVAALCDDDGTGGGGGAGGGGFTIGKTCADKYTIVFTDTIPNTVPISWDFGDGNPPVTTGVLDPISYTFTPPQKIYVVTVTRRDTITNVISTSQKRVIIIDEKANFTPNIFDICKDRNVLFNTIGIDSSLIRRYIWDFGDGTPRQIINNAAYFNIYGVYLNGNTNHTYTNNGTFFVKLIIEDKLGCLDSMQFPSPINVAGPIARFTGGPLTSCISPLQTTFTSTSIPNGSAPITQWQWTFGDGSPVLTTTVDSLIPHNYVGNSPASFYTVGLKITDDIGCEGDTFITNYVKVYKPRADFFSSNTLQCNNYQVLFYSYTTQAINPTYQWHFGDGTTSTPTTLWYQYHTYPFDSSYNIKLVVTDENGCKDSITRTNYINIVKPKADFKINDTLQCAPASIIFADSSQYANTHLWDFGDGSGPSTSPNPAPHIYGTPGFYDVKLTVTGPNGCTSTKIKRIRVRGPIGNLNVGANQGCRPFTLPLSITGGNFISTYAWDFGDGTPVVASPTGATINHVYNFAGKYLPNIVLTSPEGCPFTLSVTDTVFVDSLRAKFTTPIATFCQTTTNQLVTFTNLTSLPSFSNLLNSTWHFGDGQTQSSTAGIVTHTYSGYGTFYPYLATRSKYGCIDTFRLAQPIIINLKPVPSITGADVYCLRPGSMLSYNGNVSGPATIVKRIWKIDADSVANTPNLNINYRVPGIHVLKYIVFTDKGCVDSITKSVIIDSVATKFVNTPTQWCGPKLVSFTNQSTHFAAIQNFIWNYGDGTPNGTTVLSPTHLYNSTGSYNVKLCMETINGCKDSILKPATVVIDSIPKATINGATVFCLKPASRVQFTSTIVTLNPIVKYRWYVDNTLVGTSNNLDIDYRTPGNHMIRLYVETNKGCSDSVFRPFIVDSVVAKFTNTPTQWCGPKLVTFANTSTHYAAIQNYIWTYGDGTPNGTTVLSPTHLYNVTGSYDVKLYMETINGCKDSILKPATVIIDSIPKATINSANVFCLKPGSRVQFTSTVVTLNPIVKYRWYVDNSLVGTNNNLDIDYRTPGNHMIRLYVETDKGCSDSVFRPFIVDSVVAKFTNTPTQWCGPKMVNFTNQSTHFAAIQNYVWTYGDGMPNGTTVLSPTHLYNLTGSYDVKLYMETINGCKDSILKPATVVIDSIPKVTINGATVFCLKPASRVQFTSTIVTLNPIVKYRWYVDNNLVGTNNNLDIDYRTPGNHVVSLYIETNRGCSDSVFSPFIVDSVVAKFTNTPTQWCGPKLVSFTNQSTHFAAIQNYIWTYGDGTPNGTTVLSPTHLYNSTGSYNVKLYMETINGCKDSILKPAAVVIDSIPKATINGASVFCLKPASRVQFTSTIVTLNPIVKYRWYVDNNLVGTNNNLDIDYRTPGNHVVSLYIETNKGCSDSVFRPFIVDSVVAKFTNMPTQWCGPKLVSFTNQSTHFAAIQNYIWTYGDGTANGTTVLSPTHLYNLTGSYNVKLYMETINGCKDSILKPATVIIDSIPKATINGANVFCLKPASRVQFSSTVVTLNPIVKYRWYVDNNLVGTNNNLDIDYRTPGNHVVSLYIETNKGCSDSVFRPFIVDSVVAKFTNTPTQWCGPKIVTFANTSTHFAAIQNYVWTYGDGTPNGTTVLSPTHLYNLTGSYNVKLYMETINGCKDSVTQFAIRIDSIPRAVISGAALHCAPGSYSYTSNSSTSLNPITGYQWKVDGNIVSTAPTLNYYFNAGNHTINLKLVTNTACEKDTTLAIKVDSLVSTFTIPNPIKCGVPSTIAFTNTAFAQYGVGSYLWNFGNGSTANNTLPNPTSVYNAAGVYPISLKIISTTGCDKISTQNSNVTIYASPTVSITGLGAACANTTISFTGAATGTGDQVISKDWKVNGIVAGTTDVLNYLFVSVGTYTVTFNVKTQYGCDVTQTKTVVINPLPIPNAAPAISTICLGSTALLTAQSGTAYSWSSPTATAGIVSPLQASTTVLPTTLGNIKYYVEVTNQFNCKKIDSVLVFVQKPVGLTKSPDVMICERASTRLLADGNTNTFAWSPGQTLSDSTVRNPLASPLQTTTYRVIGFSNNVCKNDTAFVVVTIQPTPTVNAGADINALGGETVQLNATGSSTIVNYTWTPSTKLSCSNCPNPQFINVDKTTTFKVTGTTQIGCSNSDEVTVVVLCGKSAIYIPNTFTPNNDGKNDRFGVLGYGVGNVKSFTIYDRYGQIVFQRKNYTPTQGDRNNSWDGRVKGQEVTTTTAFVYVAEVSCNGGETFVLKNSVILVK
jgi:gliding motility-associated-like protein